MSRTANLAIDVWPKYDSLHSAYEYASLQILSLTDLTFFDCLQAGIIRLEQRDPLESKIVLQRKVQWSDGSELEVGDFFKGFIASIKANPFLVKVFLTSLQKISMDGNTLRFSFNEPCPLFRPILEIPNFSPLKLGANLGPYIRTYVDRHGQTFTRNHNCPIDVGDFEFIQVSIVKSPDENIKMFQEGSLDVTCDTAFPYHLKPSRNFKSEESGLRAGIEVGHRLGGVKNRDLRTYFLQLCSQTVYPDLINVINHNRIPQKTEHMNQPPRNWNKFIDETQKDPLVLKLHDFYPNNIVVNAIIQSLESHGIKAEARLENYFDQKTTSDVKFSILRSWGAHPSFKTVQELLNPEVRSKANSWNSFSEIIKNPFSDIRDGLSSWERRFSQRIDLFKIPSMYLTKFSRKDYLLNRVIRGSNP